jgi:hypothetical protein
METHERQLVLDELTSSEGRLLQLVNGLTPKQWTFREASERWSIAENIEHLIFFELFVARAIAKAINAPAEPDKKSQSLTKDPIVLGLASTRSIRFVARKSVRPIGRWPDTTKMVAELRKIRARTLAFATVTKADLRGHFFFHATFGDFDCYQWLLVLSHHGNRHALQIEQIKANSAYPLCSR